MGKTIKSKLKCVPPRLADIKDINVNMSGEVDVEILSNAFESAVVEIGRQMSKRYNNTDHQMATVRFVGDLHEAIKELKNYTGWGARTRLATDAGYSTGSWDANDCGSNNTDFDDLYEKAVVTFAVNLNRTAKAKPQLKKLGVK
jgi:uncharacterized membrane-anchored protein